MRPLDDPDLSATVASQDGVVSRAQVLARGVSPDVVRHLVRSGRWRALHRGVYACHDGPVPWRGSLHAALLHAGTGAAAGGRTAGHLLGLVDEPPPAHLVLLPGTRRMPATAGVRFARCDGLAARVHPTRRPAVVRVEECVLDLVDASARVDDVVGWLAAACQRRLTTPDRLAAAADGRRRLRWRWLLREALADVRDGAASPLEVRWVRDVERPHGLPEGDRNRRDAHAAGAIRSDVRYRRYGVRVELDGRRWHQEREVADVARDLDVLRRGEFTIRVGWAAVAGDPCGTAAALAAALAQRGWAGRARPCGPSCVVRG